MSNDRNKLRITSVVIEDSEYKIYTKEGDEVLNEALEDGLEVGEYNNPGIVCRNIGDLPREVVQEMSGAILKRSNNALEAALQLKTMGVILSPQVKKTIAELFAEWR